MHHCYYDHKKLAGIAAAKEQCCSSPSIVVIHFMSYFKKYEVVSDKNSIELYDDMGGQNVQKPMRVTIRRGKVWLPVHTHTLTPADAENGRKFGPHSEPAP